MPNENYSELKEMKDATTQIVVRKSTKTYGDPQPLTLEEGEKLRREQEARDREKLRRLREEYEKHARELRKLEAKQNDQAEL